MLLFFQQQNTRNEHTRVGVRQSVLWYEVHHYGDNPILDKEARGIKWLTNWTDSVDGRREVAQ